MPRLDATPRTAAGQQMLERLSDAPAVAEGATAGRRPTSIGIVQSHPIQYFAPLFRILAARPDVDLTVYYCSRQGLDRYLDREFGVPVQWDIPLLDGYRSVFVPNVRAAGQTGFFGLVNPGLFGQLRRARHDAVMVHGYAQCSHWIAFAGAKVSGARLLLRGESQLLNRRAAWRRIVKQVALRPLFQIIDRALYLGTNNRDFYLEYGMSASRLTHVPYVVDNESFRQQASELRPQRDQIRTAWGIPPGRPVILFSGKLVPKKQPLFLIEAFARVRRDHPCTLVIAGDGPLRSAVEARAAELGVADSVKILGFLNQSEIGRAYASADLLVLPSLLEPWGLVVNEAMNFGLAIVASRRVGCAADLVRDGENGYVVSEVDPTPLATRLAELVSDPQRLQRFQDASARVIQEWSLERAAAGIVQAARQT